MNDSVLNLQLMLTHELLVFAVPELRIPCEDRNHSREAASWEEYDL